MRIGLLSSQRAFYGGEVHLLDLAVALRQRGHDVFALVRPDAALCARLAEAGVPVATVPLVDWFEPRGMAALRVALTRWRPDILHTHSPRDYWIGAVATCGLTIRNVATRHQLRPIAWARIKRPLLRRLDAVIAVSEAVRDGLLASGLPPSRLVTVLNGIRLPSTAEQAAPGPGELGVPTGRSPVIGAVGRLCATKGFDILLQAARLLRRRWPQLVVVVIGGGTGGHGDHLRRLAADLKVPAVFAGYRADAARLIGGFDVLAVPSLAEPFGLVTLEALARGVPVVATTSGGTREIVRDRQEGLLVPPGDAPALAQALDRMLADAALRDHCRSAGRRRVASRFTIARQAAQTESVYARVLAGQAPSWVHPEKDLAARHQHR